MSESDRLMALPASAANLARVLEFEEKEIIFVREPVLREAYAFVQLCERCSENASVSFEYLLDAVTDCDPTVTEYLMCRIPTCPACNNGITEKTRVVLR